MFSIYLLPGVHRTDFDTAEVRRSGHARRAAFHALLRDRQHYTLQDIFTYALPPRAASSDRLDCDSNRLGPLHVVQVGGRTAQPAPRATGHELASLAAARRAETGHREALHGLDVSYCTHCHNRGAGCLLLSIEPVVRERRGDEWNSVYQGQGIQGGRNRRGQRHPAHDALQCQQRRDRRGGQLESEGHAAVDGRARHAAEDRVPDGVRVDVDGTRKSTAAFCKAG
mmetsp:Transcript_92660/g.251409  ORF Transcript_92660/g.251409 Transcript_92660/m.251409 type:complete len:226 (-) Transcript_92660:983-1660(-)